MLGSIINNRSWSWAAVGKHPAAADYIRLGAESPLMGAVADWVTKGYTALQRKRGEAKEQYSWRFWLRGTQKGMLVCGLGRDSSDRIGRPFPLLIMGEGILKGWEKDWPKLPERLDKVWANMESIAARRFDEIQTMSDQIQGLNPPGEATGQGEQMSFNDEIVTDGRMSQCQTQLRDNGWSMINLNNLDGLDPVLASIQSHARLKACCSDIPRAVFLGGPMQSPYMMVVQQPLNTEDFIRLWSV